MARPILKNLKTIERKDFINVPGEDFVIGKKPIHHELGWEETHKKLLRNGYEMPTVKDIGTYLKLIGSVWGSNKPLYDADGDFLNREQIENIYENLTSNFAIWINAKFNDNNGILQLEIVKGKYSNGELIYNKEQLDGLTNETRRIAPYEVQWGNMSLENLNKRGFPTENSMDSEEKIKAYPSPTDSGYNKIEHDLYFCSPKTGRVAIYDSLSDKKPVISCDSGMEGNKVIGVLPVVRKNLISRILGD